MSRLRVLPIVEGHGEEQAVRDLLRRVWTELLGCEFIDVLRPIRQPRTRLVQDEALQRIIDLAVLKLKAPQRIEDRQLILVLLDADKDPPCKVGPEVLGTARETRPDADIACVVANVEYETWFVAGAESLSQYLDLERGEVPDTPEQQRCGKAWIQQRFRGAKYSETLHLPALSVALDLELCRRRSPSFDKLCRELEARR